MRNRSALALGILGLALLGGGVARAGGVNPAQATAQQRADAQGHFIKARDLLKAKKTEEALAELRASYDVVASPNAHLYIARCLRDLGKLPEAYVEYGRTAAEANTLGARYADAGSASANERTELESKLAFLTVSVDHAADGATVVIGASPLERASWGTAVPVLPGSVDVVVSGADGKEIARQAVSLSGGERKGVTLDGQPKPVPVPTATTTAVDPNDLPPEFRAKKKEEPPPLLVSEHSSSEKLRPYAYLAGGVGAAGLATLLIAGLLKKGTYSDLQSACNGACPPSKSGEISTGKAEETAANVGLVVGLVGVAVGVTLFVVSMPKKAPVSNAALVVSPSFIGIRGAL